ncbi:MAG: MopE-related protein [Polyangiales bacterium]
MIVMSVTALALMFAPRDASAQCDCTGPTNNVTDGAGYVWDVSGNGSVCNGTGDSYDVGQYLTVNGTAFPISTRSTELTDRQVVTGPATLAGLQVTRKIYVPPTTGAGWARFLEVLTNPTSAPITAAIRIQTNAGSDGSTTIITSSSGDTAFTTADRWLTTDDSDGGGDPSLNHNFWGAGAAVPPTTVGMTVFECAGPQGPFVEFSVTVPAGATRVIMHFAGQGPNQATVQATARSIDALGSVYLTGMTVTEINGVVNWRLCDSVDRDGDGQSCVAGDCNDAVATINTSATETCDGVDNDCDGLTDEGFCRIGGTCYANGAVDLTNVCQFCSAPATASAPTAWTPRAAGTVCRPSAGACDVAESCTGTSTACPAVAMLPASTVCRAAAGPCDVAESCTGSSAACPADSFAASSTVCRASAGVCDVAESCTGSSAACPVNVFAASSTVCRASTGVCDLAESCTGSAAGCPDDTTYAPATTVCRAAAGVCDVAESCTGASNACPADAFLPSTSVCRASTSIAACDPAETCSGSGAACPWTWSRAFRAPSLRQRRQRLRRHDRQRLRRRNGLLRGRRRASRRACASAPRAARAPPAARPRGLRPPRPATGSTTTAAPSTMASTSERPARWAALRAGRVSRHGHARLRHERRRRRCSATERTPSAEVCDGVDNDCDGMTDEDPEMLCAGNMSGAACVPSMMDSAFCGCATDADCGNATSGRICNAETRRCVDGCAVGTGRNGCPTGQFCTSNDPARTGACTTTCNFDQDCNAISTAKAPLPDLGGTRTLRRVRDR